MGKKALQSSAAAARFGGRKARSWVVFSAVKKRGVF